MSVSVSGLDPRELDLTRFAPSMVILKKSFASDAHTKTAFDDTSDEKSLWFLCVPLCRRGIWCVIRGYPKNEKRGPAR